MATILVKCPCCINDQVYRHGKSRIGTQRYRCKQCLQCFQLDYIYEAHKPGVTDKIVEMALNGSGVRDTARVLGINANTVIAYLKKT